MSPDNEDGPGFSVFSRREETIRHYYSGEGNQAMAEEVKLLRLEPNFRQRSTSEPLYIREDALCRIAQLRREQVSGFEVLQELLRSAYEEVFSSWQGSDLVWRLGGPE